MLRYLVLTSLLLSSSICFAGKAPAERIHLTKLSKEAENAITKGLSWLKRNQNEDGSFGQKYKITYTSVALMAFMVQGHVPDEGIYGKNMDRCISYLIRRARKHNGYFADETSNLLYQHSYATLALAEAWGHSKRSDIGPVLKRAVNILFRSQSRDGGWHYQPNSGSGSDISCTVAAVQALASAGEAGIRIPESVINRAKRCVRRYQNPRTGKFGYSAGGAGNGTIYQAGAGPLSLYMLGDRSSTQLKRGIATLFKYPPSAIVSEADHLAHYYCIQASYQKGPKLYEHWYNAISKALIKKQSPGGGWSDPFKTGLAVLILAVPYRYLPIYQR
ncbi:MAG: terpene cyclase/mutase family protein [Lentisphaeria bacterium]|nr:terpene cyclase/mutase family protein [Lentisphaeria bacterium]NQZ71398.1 terpene cyclase/mutase family protein [Lentisphaeria bacterium]